jgi:SRSO17 transposase
VRHQEKWRQALDMLDEITGPQEIDGAPAGGWGLAPLPVVGDAGYGDCAEFRLGLEDRGFSYVLAVKATTSAYPAQAEPVTPPYSGRGRPPVPAYPENPSTLAALALQAGRRGLRRVTWRHGSRKAPGNPTAAMTSRFQALRVRPANRNIPRAADGSLPECWLIAEWPPAAAEPTDYWLSNLPTDTPLRELVGLAKIRWRIEHDYRELKHGLGLDHFEGRTWRGWHHHVTLVTAAHLFITTQRLNADPKATGAA